MNPDGRPREMTAAQTAGWSGEDSLEFRSTEELDPLDEILGQERAMKALDIGLGIDHPTYNIYVAGLSGTGREALIKRVLNERVEDGTPPRDWIYVNNFDRTDRPIAVDLDPGQGTKLQRAMDGLIEELKEELPKAFRREDFSREKQRLGREYEQRGQKALEELEALAKEKGLALQHNSQGEITSVPLKADGEPMTSEDYDALTEDERDDIDRRQREVAEAAERALTRGQELRRQLGADVRGVERNFAAHIVGPDIEAIRRRFPHPKLDGWFDRVRDHMLDNLRRFRRRDGVQQQGPFPFPGAGRPQGEDPFNEYRVNVVVDNAGRTHRPVVTEKSPNYKNLFGTTAGAIDRYGRVSGNFLDIRAGSLLRANGGYLVVNLMDALVEPLVWKELKRSIKSGQMEFHAYDPVGVMTASAIRPEPIPLQLKLVVLGSALVYHLLQLHDEDFAEIFKVKADFAADMDMAPDVARNLGRLVQKLVRDEGVRPFDASGVAELARSAMRLAGHSRKVTAEFSRLSDVIREADFWADRDDGAARVGAEHVRRAAAERVYRSDLVATKIRELIRDGVLLIDVDDAVVGQCNGLAVVNLGDYAFGRPMRVTASVGVGMGGVINIERESKLSGQTYDKAVLILDGYLRNTYAGEHPLALSAGIAMEQSYGMIQGDSASVAELLCLLSAIAGVPLRQDIAVTGSVNQWGQVQAVGGVNEKIEGFFDVCRELGLTGAQGVCIPAANEANVVLRPDVVDAVADGRFHVWCVDHVDEAIELLTGENAGNLDEDGTFHARVDGRLRQLLDALTNQRVASDERPTISVVSSIPSGDDPRPRLPGRDD